MSALSGGASPRMDGYGERLRAGQGYDRWLACGGVVLGIGLSLALAHLRFYAQLGLPLGPTEDPIRQELATIELDQLSPLEALQKLYELRSRVSG